MPSQVNNYKCPACTGPLRFDSKSGRMACEYCGSIFTVQEIEALYEEKNEQAENAFHAAQAAQTAPSPSYERPAPNALWESVYPSYTRAPPSS